MPWREMSPVDQRVQFIAEFETGLFDVSELCVGYGISRKTGHKWIARYRKDGPTGLAERSRRPRGHPHTTRPAIVEALLSARRRFPLWSAGKLVTWLAEHSPRRAWPKRTCAYALLERYAGEVPQRRSGPPGRRLVAPVHLSTPTEANGLWTTDFKGPFRVQRGAQCHPLTIRDLFSRYTLRCAALEAESYVLTRRVFERTFAEFGLPDALRSDNGRPFASTGLAGLSRLSVWWLQLGIRLERIAPGHPEQNGSHEQFHRVLKRHTTRPPAATLRGQQRCFDRFCAEYNDERPHDALGGATPATVYTPSPRPLPTRLRTPSYAGHWDVRSVDVIGQVSWHNRPLFLSTALAGHRVAFEEIDDACWQVWFGSVRLAIFDERRRRWVLEGKKAS
jgi:putative transposase